MNKVNTVTKRGEERERERVLKHERRFGCGGVGRGCLFTFG